MMKVSNAKDSGNTWLQISQVASPFSLHQRWTHFLCANWIYRKKNNKQINKYALYYFDTQFTKLLEQDISIALQPQK